MYLWINVHSASSPSGMISLGIVLFRRYLRVPVSDMHKGHCEQQAGARGGGCANKEMGLCVSARMTGKPHAQGMEEGSKCCPWLAKHCLGVGVKDRQVQHAGCMHEASKLC